MNIKKFQILLTVILSTVIATPTHANDNESRPEYRIFERTNSETIKFISYKQNEAALTVEECLVDFAKIKSSNKSFSAGANFDSEDITCKPLGPEIPNSDVKKRIQYMIETSDKNTINYWKSILHGIGFIGGISIFSISMTNIIFSSAGAGKWIWYTFLGGISLAIGQENLNRLVKEIGKKTHFTPEEKQMIDSAAQHLSVEDKENASKGIVTVTVPKESYQFFKDSWTKVAQVNEPAKMN
jgi:uncharacterized membrane protein YcjF (UPF0283 family)